MLKNKFLSDKVKKNNLGIAKEELFGVAIDKWLAKFAQPTVDEINENVELLFNKTKEGKND